MSTAYDPLMRLAVASCLALSLFCASAQAQVLTPEGCTPTATAHRNSCVTTTVFACAAGYQTHTYVSGEREGVHFYSPDWVIDAFRSEDIEITRIEGPAETAQRATLANGEPFVEAGQFALNTKIIRNRTYTLTGETTLSAETVTLNGQEFRRGAFTRLFSPQPGSAGLSFDAALLVSSDFEVVLEGKWSRSAFGSAPEQFDHDVRAVYRAGDAGFLATLSEFGCN